MLTILGCLALGLMVGFVLACVLSSNACNTCPLTDDYEPEIPAAENKTRI